MRRTAPSILGGSAPESYNVEKILKVLKSYGFEMEDMKRLVMKNTKLLFANTGKVEATVELLKTKFFMNDADLRRFLLKDSSSILSVSEPYITSLRSLFQKLGFTNAQFTSMIQRHPHLLMYSIPKMIKPRFQRYLEIGLSKEEAVEMFSQEPSMFGKSYAQNFAPKITWFEDHVGVSRNVLLHGWLAKNPAWLQSSLSVYQEKYRDFLENGMAKEDIVEFCLRDGRLMNRSSADVIAKLKVMRDILWKSSAEIAAYPECFSVSFNDRLTLRIAFMVSQKKDYQALSLQALLGSSDSEFCQLYASAKRDAYRKFSVWWKTVPRKEKTDVIRSGVPALDTLDFSSALNKKHTVQKAVDD